MVFLDIPYNFLIGTKGYDMDKEVCQKNVGMLSSSVKTEENQSQTKVKERLVQKSFKKE